MAPSFLGISSALRSIWWWSAPGRGWLGRIRRGSASPSRLAHARAGLPAGRDNREGLRRAGIALGYASPRAPATGNPAEWTGVECTRHAAPTRTDGIEDAVGPGVIPPGAGPGGSGSRSRAVRPAPTTGTRSRPAPP